MANNIDVILRSWGNISGILGPEVVKKEVNHSQQNTCKAKKFPGFLVEQRSSLSP